MKTEQHSIEEQLHRVAGAMQYPPTPRLYLAARPARSRFKIRLASAFLMLMVVLVSLVSLRPVRAAMIEILRVGGIEIHVDTDILPTATQTLRDTFTLAGASSLAEAQRTVTFTLRYPEALGEPDSVYMQDRGAHFIIMVWWAEDGTIDTALYQWRGDGGIYKGAPDAEYTFVNGDFAVWLARPHDLWFTTVTGLRTQEGYLVENPVLIWQQGVVTYRLETHLAMAEVVALAETLIDYQR